MADVISEPNPAEAESPRGLAADGIFSDGLLGALEFVARFYHRSIPPAALVSGLPLDDGKLTPRLFQRAAARAGLSARVVRRPVNKLNALLLPVILLLKDDEAVVVVKLAPNGDAKLVMPETGRGVVSLKAAQLAESYSGYAILVKPEYQFEGAENGTDTTSARD